MKINMRYASKGLKTLFKAKLIILQTRKKEQHILMIDLTRTYCILEIFLQILNIYYMWQKIY